MTRPLTLAVAAAAALFALAGAARAAPLTTHAGNEAGAPQSAARSLKASAEYFVGRQLAQPFSVLYAWSHLADDRDTLVICGMGRAQDGSLDAFRHEGRSHDTRAPHYIVAAIGEGPDAVAQLMHSLECDHEEHTRILVADGRARD